MNNLLSEEIEKFKLFSKYSPEKTLTENENIISEQYSSPEEEIFYTLARAVGGPGTNIPLLKQAFGLFKSGQQLKDVEDMMRKKPIYGYSTIPQLLKGELESDNVKDFEELKNMVNSKGIILNAPLRYLNGRQIPDMSKITVNYTSSDEPTGDLAKTKELPAVVVKGKAKPKPQTNLNFVPEKFPLRYMMQGENVKKLQQALDVRNKAGQPNVTGKFYNATQFALDKRAKELGLKYDRNVGLNQEDFNKIMTSQKITISNPTKQEFALADTEIGQNFGQEQQQNLASSGSEVGNLFGQ